MGTLRICAERILTLPEFRDVLKSGFPGLITLGENTEGLGGARETA